MSPAIVDLMVFANASAKAGARSICWLGWNADRPKAKANPKTWRALEYGSQLLAATPFGVKELGAAMARSRPTHVDLGGGGFARKKTTYSRP